MSAPVSVSLTTSGLFTPFELLISLLFTAFFLMSPESTVFLPGSAMEVPLRAIRIAITPSTTPGETFERMVRIGVSLADGGHSLFALLVQRPSQPRRDRVNLGVRSLA